MSFPSKSLAVRNSPLPTDQPECFVNVMHRHWLDTSWFFYPLKWNFFGEIVYRWTFVSFKVKKTTPTRLYESSVLPNDTELDDETCDAVFIDMSSWMLAMFTLDAGETADTARNVKFVLTEQLNAASEFVSWELKMVISKMVPDLAQLLA